MPWLFRRQIISSHGVDIAVITSKLKFALYACWNILMLKPLRVAGITLVQNYRTSVAPLLTWFNFNLCMDIFEVKLTFDMLTVHWFSTHERVFLWKCQSIWDRKCPDLRGARTPTFGFMSNALTYWAIRAKHLQSRVFEHWLWWYRYFWSEVNIWYVNCARATSFIFDTRTGVLVKVSKFLRQKTWIPACINQLSWMKSIIHSQTHSVASLQSGNG